jgi:hypothetical protein
MLRHSMMSYAVRLAESNDLCMFELEFFAYDSNRDNQNSTLFECRSDQYIAFEDIRLMTDSSLRR